ncbi:MAG TPA: nucleotidyl transferase [Deltaproteobacteria bacterium]|nr:nucleotidyl transferase [Deltaproteobacteria bacterium]
MFIVVMAGGSGTRFWPLSRRHKPKQFLNITGQDPMVVETCNRLTPLACDEEIILVLGQEHMNEAKTLFKDRKVNLIAEPVGRNTAPCIGLGAIYAHHLGCQKAVAFLPADHFIGDSASFITALRAACDLADSTGGIVTIGIVPSRPETGYGYIQRDDSLVEAGGLKAHGVLEFVEKPNLEKARDYLTGGKHYWNGGIFVATPETILKEIREHLPDIYSGMIELSEALGTQQFEAKLKSVYENIEGISFDYGIMEKTREKVYIIPCECGWSDVGSWESLYELRAADRDDDQNLIDGQALVIDCEESFVSSNSDRIVTCLGLKNCLVVDTPETLLVADLDRSQDIRRIVDQLKKIDKENLL